MMEGLIGIPTGTFSTTLHDFFGKELDNLCKYSYSHTHTHTICYKMAFDLHPTICTWDVVTICVPITVFFPFSEMRTYQLACCTTAHRVRPQRFWWEQRFLTTLTAVSQSALPEHSHTATSLPPLAEYKPLEDCCGDGCGLAATDRNKTISEL